MVLDRGKHTKWVPETCTWRHFLDRGIGGRAQGQHGKLAELSGQRQEFGDGQWVEFEEEKDELKRSSQNFHRGPSVFAGKTPEAWQRTVAGSYGINGDSGGCRGLGDMEILTI